MFAAVSFRVFPELPKRDTMGVMESYANCPKCKVRPRVGRQAYCRECGNAYRRNRDNRPYQRQYKRDHPQRVADLSGDALTKYQARKLIAGMVQRGELKRPEFCPYCGSTENIQFHHLDYNFPEIVMPMCSECHGREHWKKELK